MPPGGASAAVLRHLGGQFMVGVSVKRLFAIGAGLALALASVGATAASGSAGHAPREVMMPPRGAAHGNRPNRTSNLSFHGGSPGVVKGADKVYLVAWGSGWGSNGSNDASGEVALLQSFFGHVGGSSWHYSVS